MYKSKLQEVCQQKKWSLPEYNSTRGGLDHCPRFSATVTVNGFTFRSADTFRSSKEAQNSAAELAYLQFSNTPQLPTFVNPHAPPIPTFANPNSGQIPTSANPNAPPIPIFVHPNSGQIPTSANPNSGPIPTVANPKAPQNPTIPIPRPSSFPQPTLPIPSLSSFSQPTLPGGFSSAEFHSTLGTDLNSTPAQVAQQAFQPMNQETHQIPEVPCTRSQGIQYLYKNQLQTYAQKRNLLLPVYSCEQEGPPHARRFKSRVTIDGQTYEGQEFLPTMKDAEHAAAKAALMSLLPTGVQEDDSGLYKNLLQELLQKEGCSVPVYVTNISGQVHMPIFVSTVEIQGEKFTGQEARSKKLAEMSAAKVAYHRLRERKSSQIPAQQGQEASKILSSRVQSNLAGSMQQVVREGPCAPTTGGGFSSSNIIHAHAHEETKFTSLPEPQKGLSSTLPSDCSANLGVEITVEPPAKRTMYNKVSVYPHTPNMKYPEGTTVLPMSNEKWVALSHT